MDIEYSSISQQELTRTLPRWDNGTAKHEDIGRSTRAGIAVALDIAKTVEEKTL